MATKQRKAKAESFEGRVKRHAELIVAKLKNRNSENYFRRERVQMARVRLLDVVYPHMREFARTIGTQQVRVQTTDNGGDSHDDAVQVFAPELHLSIQATYHIVDTGSVFKLMRNGVYAFPEFTGKYHDPDSDNEALGDWLRAGLESIVKDWDPTAPSEDEVPF
jgi:hypothetical protein